MNNLLYSVRELSAESPSPMPIFPRRQLQLMLDELGPWLTKAKAADLLARIDNENPDQSIPGEYELGVGWALSKLTELEVSPAFGKRDPDFLASNLFPDYHTVVEVTAMSDDPLSGQSSMERTANIINQFADRARKKASANLHYTFHETSGYKPKKLAVPMGPWTHESQHYRTRLTSKKFKLTPQHESQIRQWLTIWPPTNSLQIVGEGTVVTVTWKEWVHPFTRTFSSMPSEVHDRKENPIYERLKEKEKQLAAVPESYIRCVILGDAGCRLLSRPNDFDGTRRRVSGKDIILQFLQDSNIDIVCILSPRREREHSSWHHNNPRIWKRDIFDKYQRPDGFYRQIDELTKSLPAPYLEGYQARSWIQQRMLNPQSRGQYLPSTWGGQSVKISSRALLEMLSGRMDQVSFKRWITGDQNPFELKLKQGYSISDISLELKGAEHDDDYVIFNFALDPNASDLRLPSDLLASSKK